MLENIILNAGKETVLTIPLETSIHSEAEVKVRANSRRNKPMNDMSVVSARAFTVEETQKYAAAVNDPLRMAMAFPGVMAADDGNNSIIIRGNSPAGLLWRMEGMDIPNPNHFSNAGGSGGGISILSAQLLANSDFVTSAFAAEYGNAMSGVFDLRLRKGNNEKREYTLQAGVLGLNAAAEGPFSKKYKGSYLINYRYSTLALLSKAGVIPDNGATDFQDISYNLYFPTNRLGSFTLFGFGGLSSQVDKAEMDSVKWESNSDRYNSDFTANTMMNGLTHNILLGNRVQLKSSAGVSITRNMYDENYLEDDLSRSLTYEDNYRTRKWMFNSVLNYRAGHRLHIRSGVMINLVRFSYFQRSPEHFGAPVEQRINTKGNTSTLQAYTQGQYSISDNFSVNAGLHYLSLALNNTHSLEPRLSARWAINSRSSLAAGFGQHSQLQAMGIYFAEETDAAGNRTQPNRDLGFTKANHYVLSYSHRLARDLVIKAELYYQQLHNVPVGTEDSSTFSTLNVLDDYVTEPLSNKGKGRNYGIELSLEKYLRNNFYYTLTSSIYQSKYTAADGVERNTRFNGNYIATLIAGKDFIIAKGNKTIGLNVKTIYGGGQRTTPIDAEASAQEGYTVFLEQQAYTLQNPAYFRADLGVSIRWNRRRVTSTLSLDIQNLTNRLNVFNQWYDNEENRVVTNYQTGLIPVLNYKIEF